MRVRLIQRIDYWVGVPLCALLSFWHFIIRLFSLRKTQRPNKILFLELSEMGSAIIAYSSLVKAQKLFPGSELFFLVFRKNQESVKLLKVIPEKNILLIDEKNFTVFTLSVLKMLWKVRQLRIDTVIDLELFSRFTAIFSLLSGAQNRVGFHNYTAEGLYRGSFLTHRVFYNPHQHMVYNFLALVFALTGTQNEQPLLKMAVHDQVVPLPHYEASAQELEQLWQIMKSQNPKVSPGHRLLVVNPDPGDALPIRGWPLERYVEAVKQLLAFNPDMFAVIIGLKRSQPYAQAIMEVIPKERCVDLTGRTKNLSDVVALFTFSEVLITNDSGPAHFASLTDIRSVSLFGPETPSLYGPLGNHATALFANYSCSPCLSAANHRHTVCTNSRCLQAIDVSQVVAVAQNYLNERTNLKESFQSR